MVQTVRLARWLTAANATLLGGALLVASIALLGARVDGASALDAPVFVLAWAWLLAAPATCLARVVAAWRARSRLPLAANAGILALWLASTAYLATMTM